jgi:uncharacterized membrane protein HdeD (DUF308 family)
MRSQPGWHWLIVAGLIALSAGAALALKFQYTEDTTSNSSS